MSALFEQRTLLDAISPPRTSRADFRALWAIAGSERARPDPIDPEKTPGAGTLPEPDDPNPSPTGCAKCATCTSEPVIGPRFRLRAQPELLNEINRFARRANQSFGCPAPLAKIFRLTRRANQFYNSRRPDPQRGVSRSSRTLGRGCGGRSWRC
jgi:hypothetical protein